MQRKVLFLAIGSLLALAAIIAIYAPLGSLPIFAMTYFLYRWGTGQEVLGDFNTEESFADHSLEVLSESEDELMVRGNHRLLIVNRRQQMLAGLHGKLTDFAKISHIRIGHDRETGLYSVSVVLQAWGSELTLGEAGQADVSSMAALLARWVGKPVIT